MPLLNEINVKGTAYPIVTDDGYYQDMTVGDAEQLVSTQFVEDSEPYGYRTTGGSSDVGNREYVRGITGGTVAWNQLVKNADFASTSSWATASLNINPSGGTCECTLTGSSYGSCLLRTRDSDVVIGHKFFVECSAKIDASTASLSNLYWGIRDHLTLTNLTKGVFTSLATIKNCTAVSNTFVIGNGTSGTAGDKFYVKNPKVIDLTQMFGTTIADYIYSLEQANAGAGVAFFRKLFPNAYYPYNSGELMHVSGVSSHDMVGFNQWDEEWELGAINASNGINISDSTRIRTKNYVPVLSDTDYFFCIKNYSGQVGTIVFYDANKNYVKTDYTPANAVLKTPKGVGFMRICFYANYGTTYNHDICINLSWSGWRNGEYEPYEKHSYPLDSSLTLRGIPKLDAQNHLYYDGDVYAPDGTVTRRYGIVDLGTLEWQLRSTGTNNKGWSATLPNNYMSSTSGGPVLNWLTTATGGYVGDATGSNIQTYGADTYDVGIYHYSAGNTSVNSIYCITKVSDAPSGHLVYELATPTTETAEPYTEIQICDDFGTEEYVSTSIVPVGHETGYPANLRDKLQHLPDLADTDGSYIISQSNKHMALAPLPIVVPAPPTTDGTYTMKATVESGVPTMVWVADE